LSATRFTHPGIVTGVAVADNAVLISSAAAPANLLGGTLRWLDGPQAGLSMGIMALAEAALVLDLPLDSPPPIGARVILREGCDRTLASCAARFGNAVNFQGEPFLPGNDLVTRYPSPVQ